jgi:hypothetical protein
MKPQWKELDAYLHETGMRRDHLMADQNRPLVVKIGDTEYVDLEDAGRYEAWVKSAGLYARAGLKLPQPDLRPRWSSNTEAA